MSGGILCKGVVLKVHRVINYNSMYIIIGYDVSTPLMTMYEIMTLCKHRMSQIEKLCLPHLVTLVTMVRATILIMLIKILLRLENQSLSFALVATTIQLGTRTNKVKAENAEYNHNRHLSSLKILHLPDSFCTTSGCDGFDKYQV